MSSSPSPPVGRWPAPTGYDHHTPLADFIDRTEAEPFVYESDVRAALEPDAGPLLRSEFAAISGGRLPDPRATESGSSRPVNGQRLAT